MSLQTLNYEYSCICNCLAKRNKHGALVNSEMNEACSLSSGVCSLADGKELQTPGLLMKNTDRWLVRSWNYILNLSWAPLHKAAATEKFGFLLISGKSICKVIFLLNMNQGWNLSYQRQMSKLYRLELTLSFMRVLKTIWQKLSYWTSCFSICTHLPSTAVYLGSRAEYASNG